MAISRVTTWSAGQVLTASDLNGEFNNILNNALNLISPLTGNLNANSKQITNLLLEVQAASQTAANEGRIYWQSTEDQIHVDDGTNVRRVPAVASVTRGDVIYASANNQWARLGIGAAGRVLQSDGTDVSWAALGANPTGTIGLTAVNGSATTVLRSDGAPALSQAIAPTWTASHTWSSDPAAGSAPVTVSRGGTGNNRPAALLSMDHTSTSIGNTPHLILRNTDTTNNNFTELVFRGTDDGAGVDDYVVLACQYTSHAASSEAGALHIATMASGTLATRVTVGAGVQVGSPTGGDKGAGTLNATAVYDDNTLLTDHVFDAAHGRPIGTNDDPDIENWQRKFDTTWLIPSVWHAKCLTDGHLPEMPTQRGEKSTGQILNALTMAVEVMVIHQREFLTRLEAVEARP